MSTNEPSPSESAATAERELAASIILLYSSASRDKLEAVQGDGPSFKEDGQIAHEAGLEAIIPQIAAHCAAATAKERQARELAEGENARLREDGRNLLLHCFREIYGCAMEDCVTGPFAPDLERRIRTAIETTFSVGHSRDGVQRQT